MQERLRDSPTFETFSEEFVFAACLGFSRRMRIPFQKSGEAVPWEVLAEAGGEEIVNILAVVATGELEFLSDARLDERLKIFEEYLQGGRKDIEAELSSSAGKKIQDVLRD
jgi:dnd system-associated protein 4